MEKPIRILIADDDEMVLDMLTYYLKQVGYTVIAAHDGQAAVELYERERPDITISDLRMPLVDGFGVLQAIRARDPEAEVILATGHGDMESALAAIHASASDFITKPIRRESLENALRRAENRLRLKRELRVAQELLRTSEAHYRAITEAAFVGIAIVDEEGILTFANQAASDIVGYSLDELIGKPLVQLVPPDILTTYRERVRDGHHVQYEISIRRRDGTPLHLLISTSPLWDAAGQPRGRLNVIVDITQRKRLEEQNHLQVTALEAAANAIVITDREGNILWVNPAFTSLTGYTAEEAIGQNPRVLKSGAHTSSYYRDMWETILSGRVWHNEVVNRRKDGSFYTEEMTITPVRGADGEIGHFVAIKQDVTERKRAEEELRRYANEQATLYAVASTLARTLDQDELLSSLLDEIMPALRADAAWIVLFNPTLSEPPRIPAWRGLTERFVAAESAAQIRDCPVCMSLLQGDRLSIGPVEVRDCPRLPCDILEESRLHSHIGVALHVENQPVGFLNVGWREPHTYTEAEQALLIAISRQVGLALRNAQLYQAARQVSRLQTLNEISAAANASLELDVMLRDVLERTRQALGAAEAAILLRDAVSDELVFTLTTLDEACPIRGQRLAPGQSIAGWVVRHGQASYTNDVHQDARWCGYVDTAICFETRSLVCAPLVQRGEVSGVIEVINKLDGEFDGEDVSMLEAIASIVAAAMENARLLMNARARAEELMLLNEIGLALSASLDIHTIIRVALAQIQRLFRADAVALLQPDPRSGELYFVGGLVDQKPVAIPARLRPGEGIVGWAVEKYQPVLSEDVTRDPRSHGEPYLEQPIRALMVSPLPLPGRTLGALLVGSLQVGLYAQNDLNLLQAIGSTLAVALENANLYDELRKLLREREEAQARLMQAEKISALGRLTASIAHEINNPLQAVQGCLTLVEEGLEGQLPADKIQRYLLIASHEIERISTIVRRMRDFYRPAHRAMEMTDVHQVLASVLELTHKQLQHSGISVIREWAADLPAIEANPDHLRQVFLNLVINAIDAMPSGGTLRTRTAIAGSLEAAPGHPSVRIEFSDTGVGMSPETQARLFEPFFTTKDHGSGLGLSISYGIVESHSGQLRVESQLGAGTTFTILLPTRQP